MVKTAHRTEFRRAPRAGDAPRRAGGVRRRPWLERLFTTAALGLAIIVILAAAPHAQGTVAPPAAFSTAAAATVPHAPTGIDLLVGRSTVLNVERTIARVSLTVPDIADAMVTAPSQLLIHGKQPGTISLFVWDRAGGISTYEVNVRRDLTPLVAHLKQLFPSESMTVMGSGRDVVISGTVSSKYVVEKAAEIAGGYVDKKENVVNLLKQQEGVASNQVMLRVRFAEVSRSAVTELGAALFTGPGGFHDYVTRSTTQQFGAPNFELTRESMQGAGRTGGGRDTVTATGGKLDFSDFLNLFVFNNKYNVGTVVKALQERGLFQSLAEPNLVATNGKEASFLAGGEFPIPVVQGGQSGNAVTIMFKEFGVRLNFTPTVLGGDLINLKVRPEVSALDFNNAVVVEGFRVPALTTRRTETEVELRDGQTFAIAGLMNQSVADSMRKIPGIGDIPILGWLFKSKAMHKAQTELVVMITPHIVRRGQMGVSEGLPSPVEPYLGPPSTSVPNPDAYVGSPHRAPTPPKEEAPRGAVVPVPATVPRPAAGAISPATPDRADEVPLEDRHAGAQAKERGQRAEEQRRKEAAAAEKRRADEARKEGERRRQVQRLEEERQRREAEVARKAAESARRNADREQKRQRAVDEAAARLREAQEAYQAEVARTGRSR